MKKIKLFRLSNWNIEQAEEIINKWVNDNNVDIISATSSTAGDNFTTTIVYETKSDGYSLNS